MKNSFTLSHFGYEEVHRTEEELKRKLYQWVHLVNKGDEELLYTLKDILPSILHHPEWGWGNEDEEVVVALSKIMTHSSEERVKIRQVIGNINRRKDILCLLAKEEYTSRVGDANRIDEAIECASISSHIPNYTVICRIGEGAGRIVYKAWDETDEDYVAIKITKKQSEVDSSNRRAQEERYSNEGMAENEGKRARQLTHSNIVRYFRRGKLEDGRPYVIEEFVDGATLAEFVTDNDLFLDTSDSFKLDVIKQMIEGIAYLHQKGYVHRDIKPNNIFIPYGEEVIKIGDLELIKDVQVGPYELKLSREDEEKAYKGSLTPLVHGSRAYTAPELLESRNLRFSSDVFSLGIVMYELFTGEHPFRLHEEDDVNTIAGNICNSAFYHLLRKKISSHPAIPDEYKLIITKCLKYDYEQRYCSAEDILKDNRYKTRKLTRLLLSGAIIIGLCSGGGILFYNEDHHTSQKSQQRVEVSQQIEVSLSDQQAIYDFVDESDINIDVVTDPYSLKSQCMTAQLFIGKSGPRGSTTDYRPLAKRVIEDSLIDEPTQYTMHYLLGMLYLDEGDYISAIAELEESQVYATQKKFATERTFFPFPIEELDRTIGVIYASVGDLEGGILRFSDAYHNADNSIDFFSPRDYCIALEHYEATIGNPFTIISEEERAELEDICCYINCYDKFETDTACYPAVFMGAIGTIELEKDKHGRIPYCHYSERFHCFCGEKIDYESYWQKRLREILTHFYAIDRNMGSNLFCSLS